MKSISITQHLTVVSLLQNGYSCCQIEAKTGLSKSTVNKISKILEGNKENNSGGRPPKLSPRDKQTIICQITTGQLDNAVQATQFINNIVSTPVCP